MSILASILVALIALLHVYILWFEMFAFESRGPKVFSGLDKTLFPHKDVQTLAANQGLYNGFLAAGLIWSLLIGDAGWAQNVALFFLVCVAIAGAYGAATASKRIFYVQTVPALLAVLLVLFT